MSLHLSASSNAKLTSKRLAEDDDDPWAQFYRGGWGANNGVVLEDIPFLPIRSPLDQTVVVVRNCYWTVRSWIDGRLSEMATLMERREGKAIVNSNHLVIYGSPGIGKTTMLSYLLLSYMERKEPCAFHAIGSSSAYLFVETGCYEVEPSLLFKLKFLKPLFIALDSADHHPFPPELVHVRSAVIALATPPRSARYDLIRQEALNLFFFVVPPVGEKEKDNYNVGLDKHRKVALDVLGPGTTIGDLEIDGGAAYGEPVKSVSTGGHTGPVEPGASSTSSTGSMTSHRAIKQLGNALFELEPNETYSVDEIYDLLGPSFRQLLRPQPAKKDGLLALLGLDPTTALGSAAQLTRMLQEAEVGEEAQWKGFDRLLFILPTPGITQPTPSGPAAVLCCPTRLLRALLRLAVMQRDSTAALKLAQCLAHSPQLAGVGFEVAAFRTLAQLDIDLVVTPVTGQSPINLPKRLTLGEWDPVNSELDDSSDGLFVLPPRFASLDGVALIDQGRTLLLFQVTLSRPHEVVSEGIEKVIERVPADTKIKRFIFVFIGDTLDRVKGLANVDRATFKDIALVPVPAAAEPIRKTRQGKIKQRSVTLERAYLLLNVNEVVRTLQPLMDSPPIQQRATFF
ncbi:uncharacterized protein JCM10292_004056 [Rhodotorula paludigena]|uniref:uncharacterized protein n=1 Tax=Rhodotorula paludigena TaxID=86838 RepID=UPI0031810B38